MKLIFALSLLAGPVVAQGCPVVPDHTERFAQIATALAVSRGVGEARLLSDELWQLWTDAPDSRAQAMLDEGMRKRQALDLRGARDVLDDLVAYCPDYAEGYNQRAFASYLGRDFAAALVDLDRALALRPGHIAALSDKGLTLMGMGRDAEAQAVLREAVTLNPWLNERSLLTEPLGQDI